MLYPKMELKYSIKNYDWGKIGLESTVAKFLKISNPDQVIDENLPYAELWMGTHPNGPSILKNENVVLNEYIKYNKEILGSKLVEAYDDKLPFLFKILSIRKALSIQVHPNKKQAEKLHKLQPEVYTDDNHKPELAIALTQFEALCGFRPLSEIKQYLRTIPELSFVVGEIQVTNLFSSDKTTFQSALKDCFINLISQKSEIISDQLKQLIKRLSDLDQTERQFQNANLLEKLYLNYPDDVGCFCIYLFNHISLQPGEAIYLKANEPHAYLFGDCVECMSCSDNVIRAGLTNKMKDIEKLSNMISYECESGVNKQFKPVVEDEYCIGFFPPIQDFAVAKIKIPAGKNYNLIPRNTASFLIVISGKGKTSNSQILNEGTSLFVPAYKSISIQVISNFVSMTIFQAFANIK